MDGEYEKTQLLTKKIVSTREKWMTLNENINIKINTRKKIEDLWTEDNTSIEIIEMNLDFFIKL